MSSLGAFPPSILFMAQYARPPGLILKVRAFPFRESLLCVISARHTAKLNRVTVWCGSLG